MILGNINTFILSSYSKTDSQKACAALVVLAYPSFEVLYEDYEIDTTDYPYIPGFLAFKEVPSLTILFNRLKAKSPEFWPQVLLVDGNGKIIEHLLLLIFA